MPDFPAAVPDIPVSSDTETLYTMHSGVGHAPATNRILTNLQNLAQKLGLGGGAGPPATAAVLRRTATGQSDWGRVAAGDYGPLSIANGDIGANVINGDQKLVVSSITGNGAGSAIGAGVIHPNRLINLGANNVVKGDASGAPTAAKIVSADLDMAARVSLMAYNPVINGNFDLWERGSSFANMPSGSFSADRWIVMFSTPVGLNPNLSRTADAPSSGGGTIPGTNFCFRVGQGTPVTSGTTSTYAVINHRIEGWVLIPFHQNQFTIGFWVKSAIPGIYSLCAQNAGNGGNNSSCTFEYTISAANVWEYKTITFPATNMTAPGWDYQGGIGLHLWWGLIGGSDLACSAANLGAWQSGSGAGNVGTKFYSINQTNGVGTGFDFRLWGVQMGLGSNVRPFWPRPYPLELQLARRYYERWWSPSVANEFFGIAGCLSTTTAYLPFKYAVKKRVVPTLSSSAPSTFIINPGTPATALSAGQQGADMAMLIFTSTGLTTFAAALVYGSATGNAWLEANAEL
jgi:hypothetical protein